ncbi:PepSY domain-containing protein [Rhizobium sp. SL42]|uniref:PepSY domain-containing protein n=1 Tax=Rhizobium sp. SL42 TaxID=2806346 RepID=UPI001F1E91C6|nr:PepSY domain-containing protein [Rhizobium sp. SL42]UJW74423.1 PepSY domain-containing protein [Rhizobium sp. SL42]
MKKIVVATLLISASFAGIARAESSTSCDVAKDKWLSEAAMKAKATELGFEVRQIKVENGCYEVYGIKDGNKVEALFNPETGTQVGED